MSAAIGLGQVADADDSTAASLVPRMLTVTEVEVPSALVDREGVGVGRCRPRTRCGRSSRCRSRRRRCRSRRCRSCRRWRPAPRSCAGLSTSLMVSVPEVRMSARIGLGQVADVGGQHRGVVGAEDVDGDRGGGAVGARDREGVGVGGAGRRTRCGRRARGVGPGAGGVDREGAVAAGGGGLRHEARRAVDVADGQRAGGGNVGRRIGLGQVARVGRDSTAASLVPRMLMVTEVRVPSALAPRRCRCRWCRPTNSLWAELAV